jgi:hypothetical protein
MEGMRRTIKDCALDGAGKSNRKGARGGARLSLPRAVFIIPAMDNQALIDQFEAGGQKVKAAIAGLSREDLLAFPVPGTWSIQQIIIHLQDADAVALDRMKRIIAEDKPPLLIGFDENKYVANLFYAEQSAQEAVVLIDLSRRQFAQVLRRLPELAWSRFGIHNERGKLTLLETLQIYTKHLEHHLKFAHEKRGKLGKPL